VTVAGESAGASAACLHAAMPSSQTLLSALLMESGSCDGVQVPAQAAATADALATQWGCAAADGTLDEGCLRALPAETVVRGNTLTQVAPILDGTLVPTSPRAALAAGSFAKVPILAGYNANEGLFFTDGVYAAAGLTDLSNYPALLDLAYGPLGPTLLALYPLADYGNDPRTAFASIIRDSLFECPTRHLFSASQAPVFAYDFSYAPSLSSPQPAFHYRGRGGIKRTRVCPARRASSSSPRRSGPPGPRSSPRTHQRRAGRARRRGQRSRHRHKAR